METALYRTQDSKHTRAHTQSHKLYPLPLGVFVQCSVILTALPCTVQRSAAGCCCCWCSWMSSVIMSAVLKKHRPLPAKGAEGDVNLLFLKSCQWELFTFSGNVKVPFSLSKYQVGVFMRLINPGVFCFLWCWIYFCIIQVNLLLRFSATRLLMHPWWPSSWSWWVHSFCAVKYIMCLLWWGATFSGCSSSSAVAAEYNCNGLSLYSKHWH